MKSCSYLGFSENLISLKNATTGCQIRTLFSQGSGGPIKRLYTHVHQQKILCVVQEIYKTNWRKNITQLQSFLRCLSSHLCIC